MVGNTDGTEDFSDISSLEERLAGFRTVPEFTMQAVSARTGVPPDTIRSWERRYRFPKPGRSDANYRLYSERDIAAITWLRQQTVSGQGTREAFEMLTRALDDESDVPSPGLDSGTLAPPIDRFVEALRSGNLQLAQTTWDSLAMAVSPESLCSKVLITARLRILGLPADDPARIRAIAFLIRKSIILFDQAGPDQGDREITLVARHSPETVMIAYALGTVLARSGFRIVAPIIDPGDTQHLLVFATSDSDSPVVVVTSPEDTFPIRTCERLFDSRPVHPWWPDDHTDPNWLPVSLTGVRAALMTRR